MRFLDIPQRTVPAHYQVSQPWVTLDEALDHYRNRYCSTANLDLDPEFQRGHVWTEQQQIAFVEFKLSGGEGSNRLLFNCPGWMNDFRGPFVLVDGKQRLSAALRFLHNEIPAFGTYYRDFEDRMPWGIDFIFCINNLPTMNQVYIWYLEINSGGTPHSQEELDRVRSMIKV